MLGYPICPRPILLTIQPTSKTSSSSQLNYSSNLLEYLCCPPIAVHLLPQCPPQLNHPFEFMPSSSPNLPHISPLGPFFPTPCVFLCSLNSPNHGKDNVGVHSPRDSTCPIPYHTKLLGPHMSVLQSTFVEDFFLD